MYKRQTLPPLIILVLYAGPDDEASLAARIFRNHPSWAPYVVEIEITRGMDIMDDAIYGQLCAAAAEGRVLAVVGGPNCRTWTRLLHRRGANLPGPK